ncbi:hypothetical protein DL95DRAFT_71346 [Leptodontidium sp. 2 PMI_412]|nr:hypothetical protein DL95DRAFT_71346 [Leptodontidium sp. 2 PMI_412]
MRMRYPIAMQARGGFFVRLCLVALVWFFLLRRCMACHAMRCQPIVTAGYYVQEG